VVSFKGVSYVLMGQKQNIIGHCLMPNLWYFDLKLKLKFSTDNCLRMRMLINKPIFECPRNLQIKQMATGRKF